MVSLAPLQQRRGVFFVGFQLAAWNNTEVINLVALSDVELRFIAGIKENQQVSKIGVTQMSWVGSVRYGLLQVGHQIQ